MATISALDSQVMMMFPSNVTNNVAIPVFSLEQFFFRMELKAKKIYQFHKFFDKNYKIHDAMEVDSLQYMANLTHFTMDVATRSAQNVFALLNPDKLRMLGIDLEHISLVKMQAMLKKQPTLMANVRRLRVRHCTDNRFNKPKCHQWLSLIAKYFTRVEEFQLGGLFWDTVSVCYWGWWFSMPKEEEANFPLNKGFWIGYFFSYTTFTNCFFLYEISLFSTLKFEPSWRRWPI